MSDFDPKGCPLGIEHEQKIRFLEDTVKGIKTDITEIKNKLLSRPSWAVSIIMTILCSVTVASLTFAFQVLHHYATLPK